MSTVITQQDAVFNITGGTRPDQGPNLFHSFGRFDVGRGDTAHFVGQPGIDNIIGRVTGGHASHIDGRLQSDASLFLLNPSGLLFGPNATLDINGSFHASTADTLRFADGAAFSAHLNQKSTLTIAAPSAFGFLGNTPAPITIKGSTFTVAENKAISVVGGDIQMIRGKLVAPSGRIQIASVASPGEAIFSPLELAPDLQVGAFPHLGRLELSQGSLLDASGVGVAGSGGPGGTILIRSGHLLVDGSSMLANTQGDAHGATVGLDLQIEEDAVIANDSDLRVSPSAAGNGGNVMVHAGSLILANGGRILTSSFGAGNGGTLSVAASDSISITGRGNRDLSSGLFSNAFDQGNSGSVFVSTPLLTMVDGEIEAGTTEESRGHAGGADIQVGQLTLTDGAQISSSTFGSGQGGSLTVTATESITIGGPGGEGIGEGGEPVVIRSGLFSNANSSGDAGPLFVSTPLLSLEGGRIVSRTLGEGNAGDLEIQTGRLTLTNGGQIYSGIGTFEGDRVLGTNGPGRGGTVTVKATDSILIAGQSEDDFPSSIGSNAQIGRGRAGDVVIATPTLEIQDGFISTGTSSQSTGAAGNIDVQVERLSLTEGAYISSDTNEVGQGGQVTIVATESLVITGRNSQGDFSEVSTNTNGSGDAGQIVISAPIVTMDDGVIRAIGGVGRGGDIIMEVDTLSLTGGAQIDSRTDGAGDAGAITITATDSVLIGGRDSDGFSSALSTSTSNSGQGGVIQLLTSNVQLKDGAYISASSSGGGVAGMIQITAIESISVAGEETRIETETRGSGPAGVIRIETDRLAITEGAQISTTTRGPGPGGILTVIAQESIEIIDESGGQFRSGLFSNSGEGEAGEPTGDAGDIVIKAPRLTVSGGRILTRTLGDGNAGDITIEVDQLELLGGGQIYNGVGDTQANDEILGNPDGTGRGGLLTVRATEAVVITGEDLAGFSSGLFSSAQIGHGNAGGVVIMTPTLDMRDSGSIAATSSNQSTGDAGNIDVQVGRLILTEGASIDSDTNGVGQGGQVTIVATEVIMITGRNSQGFLSGVFTDTTDQGRGGDIILSAPQVQLTDRSAVSAESAGKGDAGNIRIAAQEIALRGGSAITTTVGQGEASGGNILIGGAITDDGIITEGVEILTLDGSQMTADTDAGSGANITMGVQHLVLDDASAITANTDAGTGGNLRVAGAINADGTTTAHADTVVLRGSKLTANAGSGMGGRIDIITEVFLKDPASDVEASGGTDGVVNVEAVVSNLSEIVTPLSLDFVPVAELLQDRCAAQLHKGIVSSLVARGHASMPVSPEGILPSRLYQPSPTSALSHKSERQPRKTDAPQQGMLAVASFNWPQIINDPFPAHPPVALKCE